MPTEILDTNSAVYEQFGEVAATTGRIRGAGWLDLEIVKTTGPLSGVTELCLTELEPLRGIENLPFCVCNKLDGHTSPYTQLEPKVHGQRDKI